MVARNKLGDKLLLCSVLLTLFGLVMTYSSSWAFSDKYYGTSYYLFLKQLIAAGLGLLALIAFRKIDYHWLATWSEVFLLGGVMLTALTLFPGWAEQGRWLNLGPIAFQPTEGLKFALVLWVGRTVISKKESIGNFVEGILPFYTVFAAIALFTLAQPDFSMTMVYVAAITFMLFVGGARIIDLGKVVSASIPLFVVLLLIAPYRLQRLVSFLDPFQHKMGTGYQLIQSLIAFGSGGIFGRGLGQSAEKFLYLPSAYNDFIYSIVGEEIGFVGCIIVLGLFMYLGYKGFQVAISVEDELGKLLASGITFVIVFQALLNFCVTLGLLPVTGLTLPFISYGGSSLIVSLAMVGTLGNIANQ